MRAQLLTCRHLRKEVRNCQAEKHAYCQVAKGNNLYQTTNDRTDQTKNDTTCQVVNGAPAAKFKPRVVILEAGAQIGTSIMRSGNGRCNFLTLRLMYLGTIMHLS